ncbi:MAG: zf-HC2 domain-containing protein [Planctomycetota bacterium]
MSCLREDDVVARFLDGDVAGEVDAELEGHLRSCPGCRSALSRSRRLDAVIATSTQVTVSEPLADRLLATAVAAAMPVAAAVHPSGASRGRRLPWLAAALGFGLGLLAMRLAQPDADAPPRDLARANPNQGKPPLAAPTPGTAVLENSPAETTPLDGTAPDTTVRGTTIGGTTVRGTEARRNGTGTGAPPAPATPDPAAPDPVRWPSDMLVLPDRRRPSGVPQAAAAPRADGRRTMERALSQLEDPDLELAISMQASVRAWSLGLPPLDDRTRRASVDAVRIDAGRALLPVAAAATVLPLCRAINRRDEAGRVLRDAAAGEREFRARLRTALHSDAADEVRAAATRLGDAALDRRLLALCRRDATGADTLADACSAAAHGVDRVDFLLELWAQVARAGADAPGTSEDDVRRAHRWFAALPEPATDNLLQHLRSTRSGEVRRRVFLALAARRDEAALPSLLQWVESPNASDASLAAYALGCYDAHFGARLLAKARGARRPELLWTALASQGHESMRRALRRAGLARPELDFVGVGNFHPDQIAAVASLLRACDPTTLNQP